MKKYDLDCHAKITAVVIAVLCVVIGIALPCLPKRDWSDNENRRLASFPEFSVGKLVQGEYLSGVEDYMSDHFPLRDAFVSVNTRVSLLLGRREINDVFACRDGFLIDKYKAPDRMQAILDAFNRLERSVGDRRVTLLAAPTAAFVYSEKLPLFAVQDDQSKTLEQLKSGFNGQTTDVSAALTANSRSHPLYYRTDHHWTTFGAYYAYAELCDDIGLNAVPMESFAIECVSGDFCGTTYSKVNDFSIQGEEMHRFILPGQQLRVTYGSSPDAEVSDSLYNPDYLELKDKYSYFLNNIHDLVTVDNDGAQTDRHLVVIKDSYANCFVPFLAEHFSRIYVVDPRNYRGSVIDLVNSDAAVTDVLLLYNLGTMGTDTGITVIY